MNPEITFFFEDIESSSISIDLKAAERWLFTCIEKYQKSIGQITYIFVSDEYLLKMNQDHLDHDYYTDIITFNYNQDNIISGDLFISIDRIEDNAKKISTTFAEELKRVMIHGVLHLIGFNDHSEEEKTEMRKQENFCLDLA